MKRRFSYNDIAPEDIFLDSENRAGVNVSQLEGRLETPIASSSLVLVFIGFSVIIALFIYRAFSLQIVEGATYQKQAENNRLDSHLVFAPRGTVFARDGTPLIENAIGSSTYYTRNYTEREGFGHVLGYVQYPKADKDGAWWRSEYTPLAGIEKTFNDLLKGVNGKIVTEVNARQKETDYTLVVPAQRGNDLTLSLEPDMQEKMYTILSNHAKTHGFRGAAGVVIDVDSGEVLVLTNYPEISPQAFVDGDTKKIATYDNDDGTPYLDRAVAGAYTPGSIIKPFFAAAALEEKIITPEKQIYSKGYIEIPNPYDKDKPTIMKDWRAHGWTDAREALKVSSDVYFYSIGGGYEDQKGLGISKLDDYARLFGFGSQTGIMLPGEAAGVIPTPEWKKEIFGKVKDAETDWLLGDTYNTSIGQYGFQVTPIQAARAVASLTNGGYLVTPTLLASTTLSSTSIHISSSTLSVVRAGMRDAVLPGGTAQALNISGIQIAGKTGTAELGNKKQYMNSWVVGFWPYDKPKYAFAILLERANAGTLSGAAPSMRPFFEWLINEKPEYARPGTPPKPKKEKATTTKASLVPADDGSIEGYTAGYFTVPSTTPVATSSSLFVNPAQ